MRMPEIQLFLLVLPRIYAREMSSAEATFQKLKMSELMAFIASL